MAGDWQEFALEKAELFSRRLRDLLSSGQGYVRAQFGMDLGLKPEMYPTWVMLTTAAVGLVLLLGLSGAAVCGWLLPGRKRRSPVTPSAREPGKARLTKTAKPEEQKRRIKRKITEKKNQSNGQPVIVAQEEVKVTELLSKLPPKLKPDKVHAVKVPVQVKKDNKKTKTSEKPVQYVTTNDGKEPDDGAWETKVSHREKRRRKDKGPEASGGVEIGKSSVEAPAAPAPTSNKKSRVSSARKEEASVHKGGWTDLSLKIPGQMGTRETTKWSSIPASTHYSPQAEPQAWAPETQASWSSIDGRMKTDSRPVSFSMMGLNTEPVSNSMELQWAAGPTVDDEWSGINGVAAADPSSDWNAPAEHWGNYEEPLVAAMPPPLTKPLPNQDMMDADDPLEAAAKSKKKRKKKKKADEEVPAETASTRPVVNTSAKPQELPGPKKQTPSISSTQKISEPLVEPQKPAQKKKLRKQT